MRIAAIEPLVGELGEVVDINKTVARQISGQGLFALKNSKWIITHIPGTRSGRIDDLDKALYRVDIFRYLIRIPDKLPIVFRGRRYNVPGLFVVR